MSLPPTPPNRIPLSEKALAAQAAELERLRSQVAAAQAEGGKLDATLVAEFARAQRAFLEAKIQMEQMRKAGLLVEEAEVADVAATAIVAAPVVQAEASPATEPPATTESSPATQQGGRLLTASRVFWLLVIFLLTALLWFMRSPFASQ